MQKPGDYFRQSLSIVNRYWNNTNTNTKTNTNINTNRNSINMFEKGCCVITMKTFYYLYGMTHGIFFLCTTIETQVIYTQQTAHSTASVRLKWVYSWGFVYVFYQFGRLLGNKAVIKNFPRRFDKQMPLTCSSTFNPVDPIDTQFEALFSRIWRYKQILTMTRWIEKHDTTRKRHIFCCMFYLCLIQTKIVLQRNANIFYINCDMR